MKLTEITRELDRPLYIEKIYNKPYSACRYCHPSIDAALYLKNHKKINIKDINKVSVSTYDLAVNKHDHTVIKNVSSAKMSIPFSVAVSLVNGSAGDQDFSDESINNKEILNICNCIEVISDPKYTSEFPFKTIAKVIVVLKDGSEYSHIVYHPKGEPQNPLSNEELENKSRSLMIHLYKTSVIDEIISGIWNIEDNLNIFQKIK